MKMKMEDEIQRIRTAYALNSVLVGMRLGRVSTKAEAEVIVLAAFGCKRYAQSKEQLEDKLKTFLSDLDHPEECAAVSSLRSEVLSYFRKNMREDVHKMVDDEEPAYQTWLDIPEDVSGNIKYYLEALGLWGVLS
jgi:hypothetical protein